MVDPSFEALERVFSEYEDSPDPAAYLADLLQRDADLGRALERFVMQETEADLFFERVGPMERFGGERTHALPFHVQSPQNLIGKTLGHLNMVELLGAGGMGEVYRAIDQKLERTVAVKVIHDKHGRARESRIRFRNEARLLSQLEHPHVCRVYEFVEGEEFDVLVMEFIDGRTLRQMLKTGPSERRLLEWSAQISAALDLAHERRIIHRDLKPDNIMITSDGVAKVLDFGLARSVYSDDELLSTSKPTKDDHLTQVGSLMGTPMYMSPEQARGEELHTSSDMYSLGLILQWMFTGESPYRSGPVADLLQQAAIGEKLPFTLKNKNLQRLIDRLTNIDPELRPTAWDTTESIRSLLEMPRRRKIQYFLIVSLTVVSLFAIIAMIERQKAIESRSLALIAESEALEAQGRAVAIKEFLKEVLKAPDPWGGGQRDIQVREVLEFANRELSERFADQPLNRAEICQTIGATYFGLGDYDKALQWTDQAIDLLAGHLSEDTLCDALLVKAEVLSRLGEFNAAMDLFDQVEMLPDVTRIQRMKSANVQTNVLMYEGRYDEAADTILNARRTFADELNSDPQADADWRALQASAFWGLGRFDDALEIQSQLVAESETLLGSNHPKTLTKMANLATILSDKGDYERALEIESDLLTNYTTTLGTDHETTLNHVINYSYTLRHAGKLNQSEALLLQSLEIAETKYGENAPITLTMLEQLAATQLQKGHLKTSRVSTEKLLSRRTQVHGTEHRFTLAAKHKLAFILFQLGDFGEAERLAQDTFQTKTRVLGPDHENTQNSHLLWARILWQQGRVQEAKSLLESLIASGSPDQKNVQAAQEMLHTKQK